MRSVVVVLPASMCAAIPMLRVPSSGKGRFGEFCAEVFALSVTTVMEGAATADMGISPALPAQMGKGAVGLSHLVGVFLLLHHRARVVVGVDDLGSEGVAHGDALPRARGVDDPAYREAFLALKGDLDRDLVGGPADAAALDLEPGAGVLEGAEEEIHRVAQIGRASCRERVWLSV